MNYRILFLTIFFINLLISILAQGPYRSESKKAIGYYEEGRRYYDLKYYADAEQYLLDAIKTDEKFQDAYLVLAEVFWEQKKYTSAIEYYSKGLAIDPTFYPKGYLNKGNLELRIARYTDALESFKLFLDKDTTKGKYRLQAIHGIDVANFGIYATAHPVEFEPVNLGPNVNSRFDEYWPSLSADEQTLVVTRLVNVQEFGRGVQEDFFFSNMTQEGWSFMKNAGYPLNTSDNEGAQSISANGKLMVFTVCNRKGVIGRCDIYYSIKEGDQWSYPKNMGGMINSSAKETQPSLSADGRTIYFASDRPGGKGGLDIWMSQKNEDDTWQLPVNLGDSINTSGDEMSPFIHPDDQTLYFSSDYLIGLGGFDIFVSKRNMSGGWGKPKNLGYPINTHRDETGLIVNARGNTAYFASDINPENGRDIFQFKLYKDVRPVEVSYMKGTVIDEKTRQRLQANFELYNLKDGKLISQSQSDPITGEFLVCLPTDRNYMLNVNRPGYLFYSDNFSLSGVFHVDQPFLKDVLLKSLITGEMVVLNNIFYETGSYNLKEESKYELEKVIKFLNSNPTVNIEISGHTDNIGTEAYNIHLSENRAKSVVKYLTEHGINSARLTSKGYGYSIPIDNNESEEGRARNRRTELKII
jgi:outer membrane protein OmpA-like peptidoglycan-associated protein/tetratricopeptide (TPR) repeat protein